MTMRAIFSLQHADSTLDMNKRYSKLFKKGFFDGAGLTPIAGQLAITMDAFKAISDDGMVIEELSTTRFDLQAGLTSYVCLFAKYSNISTTPTMQWLILQPSAYLNHPNLSDLIVRCIVSIPSGASQVITSNISEIESDQIDKIGRATIRGGLTSASLLPVTGNRLWDAYFISDGQPSSTPQLYGWNGNAWVNLTDTGAINSILTLHRQNLFQNEHHLTDDQAEALIGTSVNPPSLSNPYVTSEDTRIPTQSENDALIGSQDSSLDSNITQPSSTNKYVTEARQFAAPVERLSVSGVVNGVVSLVQAEGPFFIGTGTTEASAFKYFSLFAQDENTKKDYINSAGVGPKLINIYLDAALTVPLSNPTLLTSAKGFYGTGDLYLKFDAAIDTGFRLIYSKKQALKDLSPDIFVSRTPGASSLSKDVYTKKEQLFTISALTNTITLQPSSFLMNPSNDLKDIDVYDNGQLLNSDDGTYAPIIIVTGVNDRIDFRDSFGLVKVATLSPATYQGSTGLASLANNVTSAMSAVTSDTFATSSALFKFNIVNNVGAFDLLGATGANASRSLLPYLGYDTTDLTGSASYAGQNQINRGRIGYTKLSDSSLYLFRQAQVGSNIKVVKLFN